MMDYIIGVDGGATKTEAVAYDLDDNEIGRGYSKFGNLFLDFNKAAKNIEEAIAQCMKSIEYIDNINRCTGIYLGLAGIDVDDNKNKIETLLKERFHCRVQGYHDSFLAHTAIHKGRDGIIVISGTGSVSYGIYKGRSEKTGGWGHIIGDEGSGYAIAVASFKKMAFEADSAMPPGELSKSIMNKMNIKKVNDIVNLTYSYSKAQMASFAKTVAELADAPDENAINILKCAGRNLAEMTIKLYKKLEINEPVNIGISGSVLYKIDIVKEELIRCLIKDLSAVSIITKNISATKGACYLHKR